MGSKRKYSALRLNGTFLSLHAPNAERVVHESGILAIWLTRELSSRGVPIICIDARLAHKALSGRINKSDRGDAEGLAHLARTGWFTEVHIRSEASERIRVLIGTRERLIRMRKDLEGDVRGVLQVFGVCMGAVGRSKMRQDFRDQLAQAGAVDPVIPVMVEMFSPIHKALCAATEAMDDELRTIARQSNLAGRLMTVAGVGPIVALAYIATLDDAAGFKKSKDVGAFLGLTPRRYQSGDMDWSGRISKCGDRDLRRLLYAAASTLLTQVKKPSSLLVWATRLYDRKYECIYLNAFETGSEARLGIGKWIVYYNVERPHSTHGILTPKEAYETKKTPMRVAAKMKP